MSPNNLILSVFVSVIVVVFLATVHAQKQPIKGLTAMGIQYFRLGGKIEFPYMGELWAHPGVYSGAVINVLWAQLEPQQGSYDFSLIDGALANITSYNEAFQGKGYPEVVAKLRVYAGQSSPPWLFQLLGGPYTLSDQYAQPFNVTAFWSQGYLDLWQALNTQLANKYDAMNSGIQQVSVSPCSSLTDEPFIRPLEGVELEVLVPAGFNDTTYQHCLLTNFKGYSAWTNTVLDYPINLYQSIDAQPEVVYDYNFTTRVITEFRAMYGSRAALGNHGLQPAPLPSDLQPVFDDFLGFGPPITFQTVGPTGNRSFTDATIALGMLFFRRGYRVIFILFFFFVFFFFVSFGI